MYLKWGKYSFIFTLKINIQVVTPKTLNLLWNILVHTCYTTGPEEAVDNNESQNEDRCS